LNRGAAEIVTEQELAGRLALGRQLRVKLGLDPTSPDIHLGHTVVLRKLRQFQDMGHKAVLIIGDYTAMIGDPTGQNTTRPMLSAEQIQANARTYFQQAGKILDTSPQRLEVLYNSQWLSKLTFADVIMLTSQMTVARMLERDTFEQRYKRGEPIGIHEFLYPLMQGYDSVVIKADVELGGTDQTFNILVGRKLQQDAGLEPQVVLTMPILVGLDGKEKMSKSKGNYVAINDSPNQMFGKLMSISDQMMVDYFTLLTDLPRERIAELTDPDKTHPKQAKVLLARTIVAQFYGQKEAEEAALRFDRVFAQRQLPDQMPDVVISDQPLMAAKLVHACGLVGSVSEAKRMILQGGVMIDGARLDDPNQQIRPGDGMVLQVGRRRFARIRIASPGKG
jgi:tyrosyl-tRNA synthetase